MDVIDVEIGVDAGLLDSIADAGIEVGDGVEVRVRQSLGIDSELLGIHPHHGYSAALAVTSVPHLLERVEQVAACDRDLGGQPHDSAAALGGVLIAAFELWVARRHLAAGLDYL